MSARQGNRLLVRIGYGASVMWLGMSAAKEFILMHNFMSLSAGWKLALISASLVSIGIGAWLLNS
jgi:hypothetical protein